MTLGSGVVCFSVLVFSLVAIPLQQGQILIWVLPVGPGAAHTELGGMKGRLEQIPCPQGLLKGD